MSKNVFAKKYVDLLPRLKEYLGITGEYITAHWRRLVKHVCICKEDIILIH